MSRRCAFAVVFALVCALGPGAVPAHAAVPPGLAKWIAVATGPDTVWVTVPVRFHLH